MAKSDFNNNDSENYINEGDFQTEETKVNDNNENNKDVYRQDYSENSDFSNIGIYKDMEYIDSSNVVYEDKEFKSSKEKFDDAVSMINKKALIVLSGVILFIVVIIIVVVSSISKYNKYETEVIIPKIVYSGETGNVSVMVKGKKDIDKTVTTFTSKNKNVIDVLNSKMTGSEILNSIIPIQEGRTNLDIVTKLRNKEISKISKEIIVCPSFTSELLLMKNISIVEGSAYILPMDFGEEECGKNIVYESSNEDIFSVNNEGNIKANKVGIAILTIRKGQRSISVNVEVTKEYVKASNLNVMIPTELQLKPGDVKRLALEQLPKNSTTTSVNLYSSDSNVVTVSKGGIIKAIKPGNATINISVENEGLSKKVEIVVSKVLSQEGTEVTEMKLDKTNLSLVQGESGKINATVTPSNAKDKTIKWQSSNEDIATVTSEGVVFARKEGKATITASTNNNISRTAEVTIIKMKMPKISASDNIVSNQWHKKPYTLNFHDSENGAVYYYGKTQDNMTNKGNKVTIYKDEKATYYVKACKTGVCSGVVTYISKLDSTKPKVLTVAGIENTAVKEDLVQIAIKDYTSFVQKWCVTNVDNYGTCQWKTIKAASSPVVSYTAKYNSDYYVFAQDTAGNVSDGYKFEITNIE